MEEEAKYWKHFSHEHPLEYVNPRFHVNRECSACKHTIARNSFFYKCKLCHFALHKVCYAMPREVTHPSDQSHRLTLQSPSSSSVTDQSNDCKACGRHIDGFYYSCTKCSLYCHMLCVALPLSIKIPSSHPHLLKLELKLPYDVRCDLCDTPSYSGWLYRCRLCEFDAHVSCAVKGTQSPHQSRVDKCHQHELMELLSQVMNGIEANNLDLDNYHDPPDPVPVSEDLATPSYQFSDACFSIDISNITASKHHHLIKTPGFKETEEIHQGVKKRDFSGIASHVWEELGPEDKLKLKHAENGTTRRSFWSKLLMCN